MITFRILACLCYLFPAVLVSQFSHLSTTINLGTLPSRTDIEVLADLDGDGLDDYLLLGYDNNSSYGLGWLPHRKDKAARMPVVIPTAGVLKSFAAEDVDRDGDQDIIYHVYGSADDPTLLWAENVDGNGQKWKDHTILIGQLEQGNPDPARFGDLTGNGRLDILYATEGRVMYIRQTETGFATPQAVLTFEPSYDILRGYLADADGDGKLDLVYYREGTDTWNGVLEYYTFSPEPETGVSGPYELFPVRGWKHGLRGSLDLNEDGRMDPVMDSGDSARIYVNLPGGVEIIALSNEEIYDPLSHDVDGDGMGDLLYRNQSGQLSYRLRQGLEIGGEVIPNDGNHLFYASPILIDTSSGAPTLVGSYVSARYNRLPGRADLAEVLAGTADFQPLYYPVDLAQLMPEPNRPESYTSYIAPNIRTVHTPALFRIRPESPKDTFFYTISPVYHADLLPYASPNEYKTISRGDYNRDGYPDFIFHREEYQSNRFADILLSQKGNGYEEVRADEYLAPSYHDLTSFDLNFGDRPPGVLHYYPHSEDCTTKVILNDDWDGIPDTFQCLEVYPQDVRWKTVNGAATPDLNQDGMRDLALLRGDYPVTYFPYLPDERRFGGRIDLPAFTGGTLKLTTGDFDGDDYLDLAGITRGGKLWMLTGMEEGQFISGENLERLVTYSTPYLFTGLDYDGSGLDRIIFTNADEVVIAGLDEHQAIELDRLPGPGRRKGLSPTYNWSTHNIVDVDGDGDKDILFHDRRLSYLANLEREGSVMVTSYYDTNENGWRDQDESLARDVAYDLRPGPVIVHAAKEDGSTTLYARGSGEHLLTADPGPLWKVNSDGLRVRLGRGVPKHGSNQFALTPLGQVHKTELTLTSGRMRCNTTVPLWITVENKGNQFASDSYVELSILGGATLVTTPDSISGDRAFYHIDALSPGASFRRLVEVTVPGVEALPGSITIVGTYWHRHGSANMERTYRIEEEIRCSYDPNDKQVNPRGLKKEGYISETTPLLYTIRFQNTGNDTAYQVVLRDTLDAGLDLSTFKLAGSSHAVRAEMTDSTRALSFSFYDIMLVDSATNEPESQGFVTYRILPRTGFSQDEAITNRASIYFDYNPPIVTNETRNTVVATKEPTAAVEVTSEQFGMSLSPNPSRGEVHLQLHGEDWLPYLNHPLDLDLCTLDGRSVRSWEMRSRQRTLDPGQLPAGMYVLTVRFGGRPLSTIRMLLR